MHKKKCQNSILEARHSARCERAPTILFAVSSSSLLVIYEMLRPAAHKKKICIPNNRHVQDNRIEEINIRGQRRWYDVDGFVSYGWQNASIPEKKMVDRLSEIIPCTHTLRNLLVNKWSWWCFIRLRLNCAADCWTARHWNLLKFSFQYACAYTRLPPRLKKCIPVIPTVDAACSGR